MHLLFSILIFALLTFAAFSEQGTVSTDDTEASQAEASISGSSDENIEAQDEEEVQLIEKEEYDPSMDDPIEIELDKDKMDLYEEEVEESTP